MLSMYVCVCVCVCARARVVVKYVVIRIKTVSMLEDRLSVTPSGGRYNKHSISRILIVENGVKISARNSKTLTQSADD